MLTIREIIKTLYNALLQRLKKHRGNWEQNDPTADDYIKNRPFYTDDSKKETVVKTTNFTATSSYWWGSPFAFIPVVGETYRVIFDGKEYICAGKIADWGGKYIGNAAIDWDGLDTGEPFFYFWYDNYDYGMCVRYAGKHTITIEKIKIVKIDERYLPENNNEEIEMAIDDLYDFADYISDEIQNTVSYTQSQNLSTVQKQTARANIGAAAISDLATVANTGDYNDLKNKPCAKIITNSSYQNADKLRSTFTAPSGIIFGSGDYEGYRFENSYLDNPLSFRWEGFSGTQYTTPYTNCTQLSSTRYVWGNASLWNSAFNNTNENWCVILQIGGVNVADQFYWYVGTLSSQNYPLYFSEQTITITQLSEELIPDTIARISELPQSDWSVHDASNLAHIKNRIAYEDVIDTLAYAQYSSSVVTSPDPIHECLAATSLTDGGYYFSECRLSLSLILDFAKIYAIDGQEYYRDSLSFIPSYGSSPKPYHEAYGYGNLSLIPEEWLEQQFTGSELLVDYDKTDNGAPFALIKDVYTNVSGTIYVYYYLFSKEEGYQLPEVYERTYVLKQLDEKFIPDTIARTEDIPTVAQPDWNQNDENDNSYVRNRTHYVYVEEKVIVPETTAATTTLYSGNGFDIPNPSCENPFVEGGTYIVTWNGVDYNVIATEDSSATALYVQENGLLAVGFMPDEPNVIRVVTDDALGTVNTLKVICHVELVNCLDEKYIPDTIARKSDIENFESNVQPDWNQNNETEPDYIKNRPFYYRTKTYELTGISQQLSSSYISLRDLYGICNTEIDFDDNKSYRVTLDIAGSLSEEENNVNTFHCEMTSRISTSISGYLYIYATGTANLNGIDYQYGLIIVDASEGGNVRLCLNTTPSGKSQLVTDIKIKIEETKNLEEYAIPDTIARTENIPVIDTTLTVSGAAADAKAVEEKILSPKHYITMIDQVSGHTYILSMEDGNLVSKIGIKHISVTTPPNLAEYTHGEYFDPTGMIVTATYYDDTTVDITGYTYPTSFLNSNVQPKITYTEFGITYEAIIPIAINVFDPSTILVDFNYVDNKDGTYTLVGWKGTYNGEPSDKLIIPDYACIII